MSIGHMETLAIAHIISANIFLRHPICPRSRAAETAVPPCKSWRNQGFRRAHVVGENPDFCHPVLNEVLPQYTAANMSPQGRQGVL